MKTHQNRWPYRFSIFFERLSQKKQYAKNEQEDNQILILKNSMRKQWSGLKKMHVSNKKLDWLRIYHYMCPGAFHLNQFSYNIILVIWATGDSSTKYSSWTALGRNENSKCNHVRFCKIRKYFFTLASKLSMK